ncbi:CCA tRNA nucleotidyltransferase 1, mitochondrial isoform X2 [Coccinella septempunctata]|uniref:CCA tRNA nucleotidyltransferase 1, mitochondrial isoform X2 n=1 Tax=Coccinella septempunctata TaxID=41139 RepID=UPI001D06D6A8|nr:CCA tRNA nucleotidyltransferase 1, mitochondrial isoform X2 [Coccinella septempunctata]
MLMRVFKTFSPIISHANNSEYLTHIRKMALPKSRSNPVIMKLDTPEFKSLFSEELNCLISLFKEYGYEIRMAGGAVRDLLMGIKPKDVDFATVATPDQMKEMFTTENIRMINMKGEKHGTITPRINDKENFEITTLRIDVVTDGRHAEVQYTTDWLLDAFRRDLTINSMFLGVDGTVFDYFFGYEDIKKNRVAFVGDATTRIREDYLRILRYFRFYGRIAPEPNNHEELTLKSIKENVKGLGNISGERIWMELKKILEGNYAGDLMVTIIECGLAPYIGLPENPNIDELKAVWKRSSNLKMNAITLLSSLLSTVEDVAKLHVRLKLSAFERDLAYFIIDNRNPKTNSDPLMPYKQLLLMSKTKQSDTREWIIEVLKYNNFPQLEEFKAWTIPKFPITGSILKEKGVQSGKFMGVVMNELKACWVDSDFKASTEELLDQLPKILELLSERKKNK